MIALVGSLFIPNTSTQSMLYTICVLLLVIFLFTYHFIRELSNEHRHAQAVIYLHYINHVYRDFHGEQPRPRLDDAKSFIEDVLNQISSCFTLVTGKACRVCLKELRSDLTLTTPFRCSRSQKTQPANDEQQHRLDQNTDFYNLWHAIEGCIRFYYSNDLPYDYRIRKYENSSFEKQGLPKVRSVLGFSWISYWPLPYRSTLVLPIRYLKSFKPPPVGSTKPTPGWNFWGFLCVDCNSRRVFHDRLSPELGLAFADLLWVVFEKLRETLEKEE